MMDDNKFDDALLEMRALMERNDELDWTMAAQSAAMSLGLDEQELINRVRGFFERMDDDEEDLGDDPLGDWHGRNE